MQLGDIYYAIFRHKWKILVCTLLGMVAAAAFYQLKPPPFQSEAKLFIRFVTTDRPIGASEEITKTPDRGGETILNSEVQILTSRDLSEIVAKNIGPEKILGAKDGGKSLVEAAYTVRVGLSVEVPRSSSTITLAFKHPDSELVQPILRDIVSSYLKRHVEIHRASGLVGDFLAQETDQLRARLAQIEEELRKLTNKAGVVSLEASKLGFAAQQSRLREEILQAQAQLAERTSIYEQMTKGQPTAAATDQSLPAATPAQVEAYQKTTARLTQIQQRLQEVLTQFTEEAPAVKQLRSLLTETEAQKLQMETQTPALTQIRPAAADSPNPSGRFYDSIAEGAQINATQARINVLLQQLEQIRKEAYNLDQMEVGILELRRQKELTEANYRRYSASLEQSRIKEAMGEGRVSNIAPVQAPTPPFRDWMPVWKKTAVIAASGLIFGLAWAFLIELYFDRTLRRPGDVERLLRLPLFLSVPKLVRKNRFKPGKNKVPTPVADPGLPVPASTQQLALPEVTVSLLEPFHQTLRDRLISFFESVNLQHKPKLIAVTGLGRGSGVTTTAAGLARSFSETGEGNVLLVDMTQGQGSAQHFHNGTPIGLDQLFDTRNSAFVQQNLYVVSEHSGSERLAKGMPQRFNQLVPKLKTSDFDYIIFDMPAVSQISITPRLASFMDLVLLVVESEKTDSALADQAATLLAKSKTNLGVVLNQTKSYVPASLHHDREFLLGA